MPVQIDLRAVSVAEGFRAALAIAVIVAAGEWVGWAPLLEAALGALLTCLCDPGGPIRQRVPAMLTFMGLGAAAILGFGLLSPLGLRVMLPVACLGIFAAAFARVWGQPSLQVGNLLTVVLVLAVSRPGTAAAAAELALAFAAGSAWALLLALVLWRIHPFRPSRRAIAECYRRLAVLCIDLRDLVRRDAPTADWDAHARGHRRDVRDAIEQARAAVIGTLGARGRARGPASANLIRLETADQIFGALIALSDLLEARREPELRAAADRMLRTLRPLLIVLGRAIIVNAAQPGARLERAIAGIEEAAPPALHAVAHALAERLRVVATLAAEARAGEAAPRSPAPLRERLLDPVRANLSWNSAVLRHALRAAVVAAPALAFTLHWYHGYEHWLTITLVLTMQPFFAMTWQRALERMGGTVLGGLAAAVIGMVCTTPLATAVALFPIAIVAFAVRASSFGLFQACLTPLVVLLSEISRPGTQELVIAGYRALYTIAGGGLAVLGCMLLWPSWEPDRMRKELRDAIGAHARWAWAELSAILAEATDAAVDTARRAAGMASNNLETSLARAMQEPPRAPGLTRERDALEAVMVLDASLRRLAGRLTALQLDPEVRAAMPDTEWRRWRDWTVGALRALEAGQRPPPRPESTSDGAVRESAPPEALRRIARQVELMADTLGRAGLAT